MELVLYKAADFLMNQSVHLAGLFVLVAVLARLLRNRSAHLRYLLWLLILIKCFVPPVVTVPLAVLPNELPAVSEEIHNLPIEQTNWAAEGDVLPAPAAAPQIPVSPPVEQPQSIAWAAEASDIIQRISGVGWLILFWLSGAGLYYLAAAVKAIRFHRTIYKLRRPVDGDLQEKIDALAERFRVKTRPRIWRLEEMSQPFVWGLVSGSIYLPADFADRVDEGKRLSILLHEMSHVKRFDPLFNFLQILAQGLYWFHPLVWIANRQIRAEREKCCDEIAIAKLQTTPKEYGSAIVEALTMEYRRRMTVPTLAVAGPVRNIEDRIKTIMQPGRRFAARPTLFALVSILLLVAMIAPTTIALTQRKGKTAGDSGQKTEDSNFTATLPNGVIVELLAVSDYPQNTKVWRPDGSNLTIPPLFVKPTPNDRKDSGPFRHLRSKYRQQNDHILTGV